MILLLTTFASAQVELSDILSRLNCQITEPTQALIRKQGEKPTIEWTQAPTDCLRNAVKSLTFEGKDIAYVISFQIENEQTIILVNTMDILPVHYLYEPPNLSLAQRIELYFKLGVVNE